MSKGYRRHGPTIPVDTVKAPTEYCSLSMFDCNILCSIICELMMIKAPDSFNTSSHGEKCLDLIYSSMAKLKDFSNKSTLSWI